MFLHNFKLPNLPERNRVHFNVSKAETFTGKSFTGGYKD